MSIIAGVDEAGRGCLAGPVVSAAVILSTNNNLSLLNDSKTMNESQREKAFNSLTMSNAIIGIGIIENEEIDTLNILQATLKSMEIAIGHLSISPNEILIDGNKVPEKFKHLSKAIIKGDQIIPSISAASIIAKVTRDRIMKNHEIAYPQYGFQIHKGYGTDHHYEMIFKYGISPIHRRSFNLTKQQQLF